jgi:hypothetical protein
LAYKTTSALPKAISHPFHYQADHSTRSIQWKRFVTRLTQRNISKKPARLLRKGGKLIIVDDYQAARPFNKQRAKMVGCVHRRLVRPWCAHRRANQAICKHTSTQPHQERRTHSPYLRLRNLPDFLASTLLFLGEKLPIKHAIVPSMLGSMALQQCLYMKVVEYRFLGFEKIDD